MTTPSPEHSAAGSGFDYWHILALAGVLFTVVGALEVGVLFHPFALGSAEWEFGTYSALMDSLPLLLLGMGFLSAFALARDQRGLSRFLATMFLLMLLVILLGALLYATNIPQVLRVGARSPMQTGVKKALAKTGVQAVVYPIALIWLIIVGFTWSSPAKRPKT